MALPLVTVSASVGFADGEVPTSAKLRFTPSAVDVSGDDVLLPSYFEAPIVDGLATVEVYPTAAGRGITYLVQAFVTRLEEGQNKERDQTLAARLQIPEGAGPFALADLMDLDALPPIGESTLQEMRDIVDEFMTVAGAVEAAQAAQAASEAASEAAAAFPLVGRDTVAELLSDTAFSYTPGAGKVVLSVGARVLTRAEGYAYRVAPSNATTHHLVTSGGVKLFVEANSAGAYPALAVGVNPPTRTQIDKLVATGAATIDLGGATCRYDGYSIPARFVNGAFYTFNNPSIMVQDYPAKSRDVVLPSPVSTIPVLAGKRVWRNPDGTYGTDFDPTSLRPTPTRKRFVSAATGSTGNDGLSPATPWPSVQYTLTTLGGGDIEIVLMDDDFGQGAWAAGVVVLTGDVLISTLGGKRVRCWGADLGVSWSVSATYPNVYEAAIATIQDGYDASVGAAFQYGFPVLDFAFLDANGHPYHHLRRTSIADVAANPGSWAYISGTMYVSRLDGSAPVDKELMVLRPSLLGAQNCEFTLYPENVDFVGPSGIVSRCTDASTDQPLVIAVDCTANYSQAKGNQAGGGFRTEGGNMITLRCKASRCRYDGFNYHKWLFGSTLYNACWFIEIDCEGTDEGTTGVGNNQATTAHDACYGLRLGGFYARCEGENVSDVHAGTVTVTLGATLKDSKRIAGGRQIAVGGSGGGGAVMYVADLRTSGPTAHDLLSSSSGMAMLFNCPGLRSYNGGNDFVRPWNPFG